jgi:NAD(P)-dependent dehydrogenase (short-subunit alcohol dehydrogenase family)
MKNYHDFTGKTALITGSSRGLGRQIALALAERGADIVVASRKFESCEKVADEIRALGKQALSVACHVGHWDELSSLVDQAINKFGRIDILVNNAGMSPVSESSVQVSEALFDKIVAINFKGPFRLAALVGSRMVSKGGGSIINVTSIGAVHPISKALRSRGKVPPQTRRMPVLHLPTLRESGYNGPTETPNSKSLRRLQNL